MIRDETAALLYVDGDVGRLVAVQRALAERGTLAATAVSAAHLGRVLARTPCVRVVAVDPSSVDVVAVACLLARAEQAVGLVVLNDDPTQRARLGRERGVAAVFSREGNADAIASRIRGVLAVERFERVTLPTVLRLAGSVKSTFALRVDSADAKTRGVIWVEQGQIVHAELGELSGANAVVAMLAQRERAIGLERETRAKTRSVHFDSDVFLSSFDAPDDEPQLEVVEEAVPPLVSLAARRPSRVHEVSESDGTYGVLAVAGAVEGVVSAGLVDLETGRAMARVGVPSPLGAVEAPEVGLWIAVAGGAGAAANEGEVEDATFAAGPEALMLVPLAGARTRILCLYVDVSTTNLAMARLEARRIAAVEPGLHDLVLTFGAAQTEVSKTTP